MTLTADFLESEAKPASRFFYNTFVNHYDPVLETQDPPQLLINCDGQAGTGSLKTQSYN